jgi:hypothetical protein
MGRLRIGYDDPAYLQEGGGIVLNIIAGYIARQFNVVPALNDMEGMIYDVPFKIGKIEINCTNRVNELKTYLDNVRKLVKVRLEDTWIKLPTPIIECE